jgi:2-polyprenyl-3-methyl-5-hydroxy-6-metoxy-1,4-benzoquinol methylase
MPLKVLISFGAEDPTGLGKRCLALLGEKFSDQRLVLTLLDPAAGQTIPNLSEHLAEYDLLITHFGLTAFEAIHAGTSVLLVSSGAYHEKLAQSAGFVSAGIGERGCRWVARLLSDRAFPEHLRERCQKIAVRYGLIDAPQRNFADLVESISPMVSRAEGGGACVCPVCGAQAAAKPHRVLARFSDRTYRRCPGCGMVYMNRFNPPPIEYEREYFFDFYKKQYGKTYIEDFPNLISMGKKRLVVIKALLGGGPAQILDIGCAYGPFLQAAREAGFEPVGIDPTEDAVTYIKKELDIPAFQGFFPDAELPEVLKDNAFSAVTFWYVIEHFRSPQAALEECRRILRPGGVLAFSTPSFQGVSGQKSPGGFLKNSPADHWTVWSSNRCKKLLKKTGFTLKKIIVTGHHPERFPFIGKAAGQKRGPVYQCCLLLSRLFGLGDTFEVYAVKDSPEKDKI